MKIEPTPPTVKNPAAWFTGDVWLDALAAPREPGQRANLGLVRFSPCARTAWHSHAHGQTLHVVSGTAWMGTRDGHVIRVNPGQTVYTPPGEEHWHGAAEDSFMEHLALWDSAENPAETTIWAEHVTDADYLRGREA